MLNPSDYPALAALAAVLRHGSFDAAARALSVTPSAISQRIKALEDRLGAPLVLRGTPCTGTATGLRLARHMEDLGLLEAQLAQDLGQDRTQNFPRAPCALRSMPTVWRHGFALPWQATTGHSINFT